MRTTGGAAPAGAELGIDEDRAEEEAELPPAAVVGVAISPQGFKISRTGLSTWLPPVGDGDSPG
eukprot:13166862-Alexandrium_andersonii.AAC.1